MPVTLPLFALTVAIEELLLLHFPPLILLVSVIVDPVQKDELPDIVAIELTVIVFVELTGPHEFETV